MVAGVGCGVSFVPRHRSPSSGLLSSSGCMVVVQGVRCQGFRRTRHRRVLWRYKTQAEHSKGLHVLQLAPIIVTVCEGHPKTIFRYIRSVCVRAWDGQQHKTWRSCSDQDSGRSLSASHIEASLLPILPHPSPLHTSPLPASSAP